MWKRKKERAAPPASAQDTSSETLGAVADDGALFSHPGAYGAMMLPPKAVKAGFFAGRRRRREEAKSSNSHRDAAATAAAASAAADPSKQQQHKHPLCSGDPARIDVLVAEAREAKEAEAALLAEASRLRGKQAQLDKDIRRLQREKEDMTETHLAQLESLRRDLETDARDGQRRLQSELEKGHAKSMDRLRLTLRAETDNLAEETKRLREDLQRTRQARATATATAAAAAASAAEGSGSKPVRGGKAAAGETPVPLSVGFWNSLTNAFTPRDFLDMSNGGSGVSGGVGAAGGNGSVPPPALLVLAAVPLFCFYRRWRIQRWVFVSGILLRNRSINGNLYGVLPGGTKDPVRQEQRMIRDVLLHCCVVPKHRPC